MRNVIYYIPNISSNRSTTRYNHAVGVGSAARNSALLTYPDSPPSSVASHYDQVNVLSSSAPVVRAYRATNYAKRFAQRHHDPSVFITTFHYAPSLSGFYSSLPWVVDVYDDPYQYGYNADRKIYQLTTPVLIRLLSHADRGIYTVHPSTPHVFHDQPRFAINGAPLDSLTPRANSDRALRCVVAGSKIDLETHLSAIAKVDGQVEVDVFGAISATKRQQAASLGVADSITFHGRSDPSTVKQTVERSDVGFCLLPARTDWQYAYPIRIGEYLAGGTVPIATDLRGIRDLARSAGIFVDLTPKAIAKALTMLLNNPSILEQKKRRSRRRVGQIPWTDERDWFTRQALSIDRNKIE